MKQTSFVLFVVVLAVLLIASALPSQVVQAAPVPGVHFQEATPPAEAVDIDSLVFSLKNLVGVGALIAALVNIGKATGIIKDGQAGIWSAGANVIGLAGILFAQSAGYTTLLPALDAQAGELANVISVVFAYVFQLWISRKTHEAALAGLPLVGKSHSNRVAGENWNTLEVSAENIGAFGFKP